MIYSNFSIEIPDYFYIPLITGVIGAGFEGGRYLYNKIKEQNAIDLEENKKHLKELRKFIEIIREEITLPEKYIPRKDNLESALKIYSQLITEEEILPQQYH